MKQETYRSLLGLAHASCRKKAECNSEHQIFIEEKQFERRIQRMVK